MIGNNVVNAEVFCRVGVMTNGNGAIDMYQFDGERDKFARFQLVWRMLNDKAFSPRLVVVMMWSKIWAT
jgi:hypothetical protein